MQDNQPNGPHIIPPDGPSVPRVVTATFSQQHTQILQTFERQSRKEHLKITICHPGRTDTTKETIPFPPQAQDFPTVNTSTIY